MKNKNESDDEFEQIQEEFTTYSHVDVSDFWKANRIATLSRRGKNQKGFIYRKNLNNDPKPNSKVIQIGAAVFRSDFESGSLESVEKIASSTYEINLPKETNSNRMSTWFFFSVENLKGEVKFIIKGFTKNKSLYNEGMKLCYRDSEEGKWRRGGYNISYVESPINESDEFQEYELRFCFFFRSMPKNMVELCYSFPYTYTQLLNFISVNIQSNLNNNYIFPKSKELREIPYLTFGNQNSKKCIVLSARVHPGESVSSFIMQGFIEKLDKNSKVLEEFSFFLFPMINVDGVFHGNYRFSAEGVDLNRKWKNCDLQHHPEIHWFKNKIKDINKETKIIMFIDIHGHSRQKGIFFYGCVPNSLDSKTKKQTKSFPYLMSQIHNEYDYNLCSYHMSKEKEGTARMVVYNELKIPYVYTLEASFYGNGQKNYEISDYLLAGEKLCEGICYFFSEDKNKAKNQGEVNELNKKMKDFYENSQLGEVSFDGNTSDSEPEAGELPPEETKPKISPKNRRRLKSEKESLIQKNPKSKAKSSLKKRSTSELKLIIPVVGKPKTKEVANFVNKNNDKDKNYEIKKPILSNRAMKTILRKSNDLSRTPSKIPKKSNSSLESRDGCGPFGSKKYGNSFGPNDFHRRHGKSFGPGDSKGETLSPALPSSPERKKSISFATPQNIKNDKVDVFSGKNEKIDKILRKMDLFKSDAFSIKNFGENQKSSYNNRYNQTIDYVTNVIKSNFERNKLLEKTEDKSFGNKETEIVRKSIEQKIDKNDPKKLHHFSMRRFCINGIGKEVRF